MSQKICHSALVLRRQLGRFSSTTILLNMVAAGTLFRACPPFLHNLSSYLDLLALFNVGTAVLPHVMTHLYHKKKGHFDFVSSKISVRSGNRCLTQDSSPLYVGVSHNIVHHSDDSGIWDC
jgi:hypothetical protein